MSNETCGNCQHLDYDHYTQWYREAANKPACAECDCPEYV